MGQGESKVREAYRLRASNKPAYEVTSESAPLSLPSRHERFVSAPRLLVGGRSIASLVGCSTHVRILHPLLHLAFTVLLQGVLGPHRKLPSKGHKDLLASSDTPIDQHLKGPREDESPLAPLPEGKPSSKGRSSSE